MVCPHLIQVTGEIRILHGLHGLATVGEMAARENDKILFGRRVPSTFF
jgi:hypothetical protein